MYSWKDYDGTNIIKGLNLKIETICYKATAKYMYRKVTNDEVCHLRTLKFL